MPQNNMSHNHMRNYGRIADAQTPLDEAWRISDEILEIKEDFEFHAKIYKWEEPHCRFERTPMWAYWFARHVIKDHWPVAESFIQQDESVWKWYQSLISFYRACGIINYSIDGDPDFLLDEDGRIIDWKPERRPTHSEGEGKQRKQFRGRRASVDIDAVSDRVEKFRKKRRQQISLDVDENEN